MPPLDRRRGSQSSTHRAIPFVLFAAFVFGLVYELNLAPRFSSPSLTAVNKKKKDRYGTCSCDLLYVHAHTINATDIGLDDPNKRAILIGDIHGMNKSFHNLLDTLSYDPSHDSIILAGDMLAKSTHAGSLAVLDFLAQHGPCTDASLSHSFAPNPMPYSHAGRVYAVRGNHDQMVVQWRAWREWFTALELPRPTPEAPEQTGPDGTLAGKPVGTGREFLALIEKEWAHDLAKDPQSASDADEWADVARKRAAGTWRAEWWRRIPEPGKGRAQKDWHIFTDHYWLAKDMTPEHAHCLFSLPLVLHVPEEHFFVVHGGLLPSDPRRPPTDRRQPLAHPPKLHSTSEDIYLEDDLEFEGDSLLTASAEYDSDAIEQRILADPEPSSPFRNSTVELLRVAQEQALLRDVPQNREAWVILNMRGVRKKGKVTRSSDKGTPWSEIWNKQMGRCGGFDSLDVIDSDSGLAKRRSRFDPAQTSEDDASAMPCLPSTVVYGHAASRGLDLKRWTIGLDTGCLYGRKLTALVLKRSNDLNDDIEEDDDDYDDEDEVDDGEVEDAEEAETFNLRLVRKRRSIKNEKKRKTWRRRIEFGDEHSDLQAELVSIKCPKKGNLS
ncbi:hypothetical protein CERSUDRAFT_98453 [Gelatoporia subvermispora B]|uniref:Calcineurin-like phosphoesterase domain-containing protein n=1 Tax=Ceriporiopsis subvermispora (strain B) TaxID=914234 RepID=M2R347_CERS8|nr:hypothetical protein CERSUDRAFT_98453 [Gelatoporia subvermispora B]